MKKKQRNVQKSLAERILFPYEASPVGRHGYRVEVEGWREGRRMLIRGARRILEACEERVILVLDGYRLSIFGRDLSCLAYDGGIAEIAGEISEISFLDGEETR